jgi:hypothetical protein
MFDPTLKSNHPGPCEWVLRQAHIYVELAFRQLSRQTKTIAAPRQAHLSAETTTPRLKIRLFS